MPCVSAQPGDSNGSSRPRVANAYTCVNPTPVLTVVLSYLLYLCCASTGCCRRNDRKVLPRRLPKLPGNDMSDTSSRMLAELPDLLPELEAAYEDIHAHPELSMQETRT